MTKIIDALSTQHITVRQMDMVFPDSVRQYWADDNPVLTALMAALSVSFPPGERYFIDSVRHFKEQVKDADLQERIKAFIGQEANHTKEHVAFNQFLDGLGYPATRMQEEIKKRIAWVQQKSSPEVNLARTAALEHFTAIMASGLLENPALLKLMDAEVARLWGWHAIEEIEHRDVAFDVYRQTVGDENLRRRVMVSVTFFFIAINFARTIDMLKASNELFNLRAWLKATNMLWVRPGIFRKIIPLYLSYYRRNFHPSQHDNQALVEKAKQRYLS